MKTHAGSVSSQMQSSPRTAHETQGNVLEHLDLRVRHCSSENRASITPSATIGQTDEDTDTMGLTPSQERCRALA